MGAFSAGLLSALIHLGAVLYLAWRRNRLLAMRAGMVCMAGLAWSLMVYLGRLPGAAGPWAMPAAELLFLAAWYLFLHRALRGPYEQSMPLPVARGLRVVWISLAAAICALVWVDPMFLRVGSVASGLLLVIALINLALSSQLLRDAPLGDERVLKLAGVGGATVAVTVITSQSVALMLGTPLQWLLTVEYWGAMLGSLLLVGAVATNPQWALNIFISPQARSWLARFSGVFVLLVLVLALVPLFRSTGEPWRNWVAPLLVASAGSVLMVVMFSERISAWLRVVVSKHFLPFRYDYREEWLRLTGTLAEPAHTLPMPERAIKALAEIVGSPAGVLWLRHDDSQDFNGAAAWNTRVWPDAIVSATDPVVRFMVQRQWIVDTAELDRDPERYGRMARPDWLATFPDALLLVPLIINEEMIGFVVLLQPSSAFRLTFEEIDLLRTSGRQIAAHLAQYESDQQLAEARQFEAFNRLTAFVMHDLKNLIAQQSLMVDNASRHKDNPEFIEDVIATVHNSVGRMNKLLKQLNTGDPAGPRQDVVLNEAVREAVERCAGRSPEPDMEACAEQPVVRLDRERLVAVLTHLVRNAQEATESGGQVTVELDMDGSLARVSIQDNGCGMDPDFLRQRLFRPFDSTKGSQGMGIGAYQARAFARAHGGDMSVVSRPGEGTRVVITLPANG